MSGAYLAYCDLLRPGGAKRKIVAAITDGDSDNLMAGRNGVLYDNDGLEWDAIFRGLEITTGGRRHNDYHALLEVLPKFGLKAEDLTDYLNIFKYGCPPHGGFAIGCERLTQKILGLQNVKETSLFPGDRKRVRP